MNANEKFGFEKDNADERIANQKLSDRMMFKLNSKWRNEKMKKILSVFVAVFMAVIVMPAALAVTDLMALQGSANDGAPINNGNLTVTIWDQASGGTLIYNSSTNYSGAITNGRYDVMLGELSDLSLEFGRIYYMDLAINGQDLSFNGSARRMFQAGSGKITNALIKQGAVNNNSLNTTNAGSTGQVLALAANGQFTWSTDQTGSGLASFASNSTGLQVQNGTVTNITVNYASWANAHTLDYSNITSEPWVEQTSFTTQNSTYYSTWWKLTDVSTQNTTYYTTWMKYSDFSTQNSTLVKTTDFNTQNSSYFTTFWRLSDAQTQNNTYFTTWWKLSDVGTQNSTYYSTFAKQSDVTTNNGTVYTNINSKQPIFNLASNSTGLQIANSTFANFTINYASWNSALTLDAGNITTGLLSTARLPSWNNSITLDAANITSGLMSTARLPSWNDSITLDAGNITSGIFAAARIPSLNDSITITANNITGGINSAAGWTNTSTSTVATTEVNTSETFHAWSGVQVMTTSAAMCDFTVALATTMCYPNYLGAAVGGGSAAISGPPAGSGAIGVLNITRAAAAGSGYRFSTDVTAVLLNGSEYYAARISVVALPAIGLNTTAGSVGFNDVITSSGEAVDGATFYIANQTVWATNSQVSTRTNSTTNYNMTAGRWYTLALKVSADGASVNYSIYNQSNTMVWSEELFGNVPLTTSKLTGAQVRFTSVGAAAAAAPIAQVDYMYMEQQRFARMI